MKIFLYNEQNDLLEVHLKDANDTLGKILESDKDLSNVVVWGKGSFNIKENANV